MLKQLYWVGSSKLDLLEFPEEARLKAGYYLFTAQNSPKRRIDITLPTFEQNKHIYTIAYTTSFKKTIYVLSAFQRKSKYGIDTPKKEENLIDARFDLAYKDYKRRNL